MPDLERRAGTAAAHFSNRQYSARSSSLSVTSGARSAPPSRRMPPSSGIAGRLAPGSSTSIGRRPDLRVDRPRLEQPDEVLEVADLTGAEEPAVVDRIEIRLGVGPAGDPRSLRRERRAVRVLPQSGQPARLEGRDEERVVGSVRPQDARAQQPRVGAVAVGGDGCRQPGRVADRRFARVAAERAVHVHVRPGPERVERREARPCSGPRSPAAGRSTPSA